MYTMQSRAIEKVLLSGSGPSGAPAPVPGRAAAKAVISLPADPDQVPTARHFVRSHAARCGLGEEDRYRAELVVSELAGNAARHGLSDMTVYLSVGDREMRIDVTDTGLPSRSLIRPAELPGESGRGLALVDLVADWTSIRRQGRGWRVRAGLRILG